MFKFHYLRITFFLFLSLNSLNTHAQDEDENSSRYEAFTVQINAITIKAIGIQTLQVQATQFNPELETFATRVDLAPLLDIRKKYFAALAKQATAKITVKQSQQNIQRLETLQREKAISKRKLLVQKNQLEIDKANLKAAEQLTENIRLVTQSQWGNVLSHWFLTEQPPYSNMLSTRTKPVYLIYLPASVPIPLPTILIHPFGSHEKAQTASLISSAPIFSPHQQTGTPYFYMNDQTADTFHQRIVVWLPLHQENQSGFIIPLTSIVWHLGQAYVYLQLEDEIFKRVKITHKQLVNSNSYFIQKPLQEGDTLVTTGAQMLLSEEFRGQIPDEDDD